MILSPFTLMMLSLAGSELSCVMLMVSSVQGEQGVMLVKWGDSNIWLIQYVLIRYIFCLEQGAIKFPGSQYIIVWCTTTL